MLRKIAAVWLSLTLLFGFVVIVDVVTDITPTVKAATLYVNETGGGGAYTTIQEAINAANPGDTVFVYSGTYYESVDVNKTINLTGEDRNTTYIDGTGYGYVITILSDWVNVSGFALTSNGMIPSFTGIHIDSNYNTIYGNNISSNIYFAIRLYSSSWNTIIDNNISNLENGITIVSSDNNTISNNLLSSKGLYNIQIWASKGNNLTNNEMIDNGISIGRDLQHWNENYIDTSNTVNGKPVYYWKNMTGGKIPLDAGQVILANCTNVTVEDQIFINCSIGIQLGYSSGNQISDNLITSNSMHGIYLQSSSKNNIIANNVSHNIDGFYLLFSNDNSIMDNNISYNDYGINIDDSHFNLISNNTVTQNKDRGIYLIDSRNNDIKGNNVSNSERGIHLQGSSNDNNVINNSVSYGYESGIFIENSNGNNILKNAVFPFNDWAIFLGYSFWNNISGNNISNSNIAVYLHGAENNNITNNNFSLNGGFCFYLWDSVNNSFYHNNLFKYMASQASDPSDNGNKWDNGYPSGGNYWSDYGGVDNYKGPYQNFPGHDGIGDTPYATGVNNQDNYPLMEPYIYKPLDNYIMVKQGWNLISTPLIQDNQDLLKVLEMIDGYYDAVQWYNLTDPSNPWEHYRPGKPFGNDLFHLNESMGFWIHITNPGDTIFLYNGTQPTVNQSIALHPGWNMVGYPSLSNRNRTAALNNIDFGTDVDATWTFNATTQTWKEIGPTDYFELGRGYWIHSKVTKVWDVPL